MNKAKQTTHVFQRRGVISKKRRKSNVIVYKGVNLKHPLDVDALQATGGFIDIPPIWQSTTVKSGNVA